MSLIKICGINDAAAFDAAVAEGADYVGFVFFPPSPRHLTPEAASVLSRRHAGGPKRVGLFVTPNPEEIAAVLRAVPLDILQLHASKAAIDACKARFGLPVWRALGVADEHDFPAPDEVADGFVVEAKPPPGATRPGGNAVRADWELLARWEAKKPWLLAGGLTPGNVAEALARTGAPGVDVSSGVETAPGKKSPALIRGFIQAVKDAAFLKKSGAKNF